MNVPFTAYRPGLCALCGRPYEAGEDVTSTADHTVVPARFRHFPACPPRPLPRLDPLAEHRDKPLRVRGTLGDGIEFDMTLSGAAADLLRVDGRGFSLRLPPPELCEQRPRPTGEPIIRRPA